MREEARLARKSAREPRKKKAKAVSEVDAFLAALETTTEVS